MALPDGAVVTETWVPACREKGSTCVGLEQQGVQRVNAGDGHKDDITPRRKGKEVSVPTCRVGSLPNAGKVGIWPVS